MWRLYWLTLYRLFKATESFLPQTVFSLHNYKLIKKMLNLQGSILSHKNTQYCQVNSHASIWLLRPRSVILKSRFILKIQSSVYKPFSLSKYKSRRKCNTSLGCVMVSQISSQTLIPMEEAKLQWKCSRHLALSLVSWSRFPGIKGVMSTRNIHLSCAHLSGTISSV